jgi:hypothetical protein
MRRVSGIFFRYAQSQNIGKQNNLKVIYHTYRDVNKLLCKVRIDCSIISHSQAQGCKIRHQQTNTSSVNRHMQPLT